MNRPRPVQLVDAGAPSVLASWMRLAGDRSPHVDPGTHSFAVIACNSTPLPGPKPKDRFRSIGREYTRSTARQRTFVSYTGDTPPRGRNQFVDSSRIQS